jgi:hypothetical protein
MIDPSGFFLFLGCRGSTIGPWMWNEPGLSDAKGPSLRRWEVLGENVKCVGVTPSLLRLG